MREILLFAGTTEGRRLSDILADSGIAHTVCVATAYGEEMLTKDSRQDTKALRESFRRVCQGRMDREQIRAFLLKGDYCAVVDATHPYARAVTENIRSAMEGIKIPYLRLKREEDPKRAEEGIYYFDTHEECARELEKWEGNILLTVGSSKLGKYCTPALQKRLYVRILPDGEGIAACEARGITKDHIIAMQGPFCTALNEALIQQYRICGLVTKESGTAGGYTSKVEAAARTRIPLFVIGRAEEEGYSLPKLCEELMAVCGKNILWKSRLEIVLAGVGMGNPQGITREVEEAIAGADLLMGSERLIREWGRGRESRPYYTAQQVLPCLQRLQEQENGPQVRKVVILFSGDSGFYSGCRILLKALKDAVAEGSLRADLRVCPGISAVSYLAAEIGESYEDAWICSLHGKHPSSLARRIGERQKTFLLMSGAEDVVKLGNCLVEAGMEGCEVTAGFRLSYPGQRLLKLTPKECLAVREEGLCICFVKNPGPMPKRLTHGMADDVFLRDRVPMTKEEIREVSLSKLRLEEGCVLYDVGSGTGSVAVEAAMLSPHIKVFALERSTQAAALAEANRRKFMLDNLQIVQEEAPEGFRGLPAPTHAFIGGSGGRLWEILAALYECNPRMRVVINAVSMETVCEMRKVSKRFPVEGEELVQIQVSRMRAAGQHHLMQAQNPVWIMAFHFVPGETKGEKV